MISIPRKNDFTLAFPFIERSYMNSVAYDTPMDMDNVQNIVVSISNALGSTRAFPCYTEKNVVYVNFPETLEVGKYDVIISAIRDGKDICSLLQKCFAIVEWNNKSDYLDYIIGSPLLSSTSVFVANKSLFVQQKEVTISNNGELVIMADEGYALSSVKVSVDVQPTEEMIITENGIYDVTNYKTITVNVEGGGSEEPENEITEDDIEDLFDEEQQEITEEEIASLFG